MPTVLGPTIYWHFQSVKNSVRTTRGGSNHVSGCSKVVVTGFPQNEDLWDNSRYKSTLTGSVGQLLWKQRECR